MAGFIFTIGMRISKLPALMTMRNNIRCYALSQPVIKHKIFTNEFTIYIIFFSLPCIINDATFQMKNIVEAIVQHVSTCFLTTYTTCTIHDDILFLFILHHVNCHGQLFPESVTGYFDGIFKVAYFKLIMIAHIYHHGVRILQQGIHLYRIYIPALFFHTKGRVCNAIGYNFMPHFYFQYPK